MAESCSAPPPPPVAEAPKCRPPPPPAATKCSGTANNDSWTFCVAPNSSNEFCKADLCKLLAPSPRPNSGCKGILAEEPCCNAPTFQSPCGWFSSNAVFDLCGLKRAIAPVCHSRTYRSGLKQTTKMNGIGKKISSSTLHGISSVNDLRAWSACKEDKRKHFLEIMFDVDTNDEDQDEDADGDGDAVGDGQYAPDEVLPQLAAQASATQGQDVNPTSSLTPSQTTNMADAADARQEEDDTPADIQLESVITLPDLTDGIIPDAQETPLEETPTYDVAVEEDSDVDAGPEETTAEEDSDVEAGPEETVAEDSAVEAAPEETTAEEDSAVEAAPEETTAEEESAAEAAPEETTADEDSDIEAAPEETTAEEESAVEAAPAETGAEEESEPEEEFQDAQEYPDEYNFQEASEVETDDEFEDTETEVEEAPGVDTQGDYEFEETPEAEAEGDEETAVEAAPESEPEVEEALGVETEENAQVEEASEDETDSLFAPLDDTDAQTASESETEGGPDETEVEEALGVETDEEPEDAPDATTGGGPEVDAGDETDDGLGWVGAPNEDDETETQADDVAVPDDSGYQSEDDTGIQEEEPIALPEDIQAQNEEDASMPDEPQSDALPEEEEMLQMVEKGIEEEEQPTELEYEYTTVSNYAIENNEITYVGSKIIPPDETGGIIEDEEEGDLEGTAPEIAPDSDIANAMEDQMIALGAESEEEEMFQADESEDEEEEPAVLEYEYTTVSNYKIDDSEITYVGSKIIPLEKTAESVAPIAQEMAKPLETERKRSRLSQHQLPQTQLATTPGDHYGQQMPSTYAQPIQSTYNYGQPTRTSCGHPVQPAERQPIRSSCRQPIQPSCCQQSSRPSYEHPQPSREQPIRPSSARPTRPSCGCAQPIQPSREEPVRPSSARSSYEQPMQPSREQIIRPRVPVPQQSNQNEVRMRLATQKIAQLENCIQEKNRTECKLRLHVECAVCALERAREENRQYCSYIEELERKLEYYATATPPPHYERRY